VRSKACVEQYLVEKPLNLLLAMSPLEQKMRQTNEIKLRGKDKKKRKRAKDKKEK